MLYSLLTSLAEAATELAPGGDAKWARALRERRGLLKRYDAFAAERDVTRPLAWFHAPSVGEALMALPVAQRIRGDSPRPQLALTWFSPSAVAFAQRFEADFADYLPFDTARAARRALADLRPTALVFSRLDVWPTLTREASRAGVRLGLITAAVRADSSRLRPLARAALRDAYARLDVVGAVSQTDAGRLVRLGVREDAIRVTGDTQYDQVAERARSLDRSRPEFAGLASDRPTVVAGSTWPSDNSVLLPAWEQLRQRMPSARLIIAPHEPGPEHLAPIAAWARGKRLSAATLATPETAGADVVLVDRVGVLAELYSFGQVAVVGGGFHDAGLHSVLEAAAHGVPVLFGPQGRRRPDAARLEDAGGAVAVADFAELARRLQEWLGNAQIRAVAARAAREAVDAGTGAADRSAALVRALLA